MSNLNIQLDKPIQDQLPTLFATVIFTALAFVLAFAWSSAFQKLFTDLFGHRSSTLSYLTYAFLVTIVVVLLIYFYQLWKGPDITVSVQTTEDTTIEPLPDLPFL